MAKLRGTPTGGRKPPSYGARIVVRVDRGQAIVQKWPRRRRKVKSAITKAQNLLFKERNKLAKYAWGEQQWMAIEIAKNSPLYPRDLLMSAMAGRLFETLTIDGKVYTAVAVRDDVSADLDLLAGTHRGTILYRDTELWLGLIAGDFGHVLTSGGPTEAPAWLPPGGQVAARVDRATTIAIPGAVTTFIDWDQVQIDDIGMWDVANPSRLTMPNTTGRVTLTAGIVSTANVFGNKVASFRRNGTDFLVREDATGTTNIGRNITTGPLDFQPNDYFEVGIFSSAAFTLENDGTAFFAAEMSIPAPAPAPVDPFFADVVLLPPFTDVIDDDASNSDHTLTGVGNAQIVAGELDLDGNGDAVSAPDSADWDFGTGDFTLEMFVDSRTEKLNTVMFSTAPSNGAGGWIFEFGFTNGVALWANGAFRISTGSGHIIKAVDPIAHVAVTREGNTLRLWHNGFQIGSDTVYAGAMDTSAVAGLRIGNYTNEALFGIDGVIRGPRITKAARWSANFTPPALPLPTS